MPVLPHRKSSARGVTLVELLIAMGIMAFVTLLATQTFASFARTDNVRRKVTDLQGRARVALGLLERELRHASLGAGTGRIWVSSGGNRVARPAVQIFSSIPGFGPLDLSGFPQLGPPKGGTDALLVAGAIGGARAATVGELTVATAGMPRTFAVTTTSTTIGGVAEAFAVGDRVLLGDYLDASWGTIEAVQDTPAQLRSSTDLMLPGAQLPRLAAGSIVRRARARLYYVDDRDQLVRLELLVPRAPATAAEILGGEVLAAGVENLQVGCQLAQADGTLGACSDALPTADPIATESAAFFGTFVDAGTGPLLADASGLRTLVFSVAARSLKGLQDTVGEEPIPLDDGAGGSVSMGDTSQPYARRSYQLTAGIRNTSLGAF
jgi:type II secretory pathway pseudopilin PulG